MLSDDQIDRLMDIRKPYSSAKAIERAVMKRESALRKDDEALIRQMLEALTAPCAGEELLALKQTAITAARSRLEKAP